MPPHKERGPREPLGASSVNITCIPAYLTALKPTAPVAPAQSSVPKSNKRKASPEPADVSDSDSDDEGVLVTESCGQVRRKINNFLESGEMKKGEFYKALGCSGNGVLRFLAQTGPYGGSGSDVYYAAFKFFKKREAKGIKMPTKKKVKKGEEKVFDMSEIKLDGEENNQVKVFESCDEIRKKIRAHLKSPSTTQASFLRSLAQVYNDGRKVQSKSLQDFLGKKGPNSGNTSMVFYASYVFFEKLRLKEGKAKSGHRLEMEKIYAGKGMDTKRIQDRFWVGPGEVPSVDEYGQLHIHRIR